MPWLAEIQPKGTDKRHQIATTLWMDCVGPVNTSENIGHLMHTIDEIQAFLDLKFPSGGKPTPQYIVKGPLHTRAYSRIYYAEHPSFPFPVALKVCLKPYTNIPDQDEASQQFHALQKVHETMRGDTSYTVPQALHLFPEEGCIIIEWIDGTCMTDLIYSWRSSPTKALLLSARAGKWLSHFHSAHLLSPGKLDVHEKLQSLKETYRGSSINDERFMQAISTIEHIAPLVAEKSLAISWIHGDYKPDNLLISEKKTVAIDIYIQDENACIHDIASFLNQFELACYHPSGWRLLPFRSRLENIFLEHYSADLKIEEGLPLCWLRLYSIVSLWNKILARKNASPTVWYLHHCFRRITQRLQKVLLRQSQSF